MVWNIPFVSWKQLSWLGPLSTLCQLLANLLGEVGRGRKRENHRWFLSSVQQQSQNIAF